MKRKRNGSGGIRGTLTEFCEFGQRPSNSPRSEIRNLKSDRRFLLGVLTLLAMLASSCRQEMADQGKFAPMDYSAFFKDEGIARPQPTGTVARTQFHEDPLLYTGMQHSKLSPTFPFPITRDVLKRGQQRFNIYCAPCHDNAGTGKGLAVQSGFARGPSSFHDDRLRQAAPGYFYQAISNGFGIMNGYAAQIEPTDRWAIVAYIRALQLSEHAVLSDLPDPDKKNLEAAQ